ncbi:MAG: PD40 domain-containing protein, partial [Proteobacteria bacterium]|nr:PD40 domain-containing protein [Pseudomonadota bacterium]
MTDPIRRLLLRLALLGLALASLPAQAQLTIQITRGVTTPIPVAVVPFGGAGPLPVDVAQVVGADLERSGRFATLPRESLPQRPVRAGEVDFAQWRLVKTDFVVIGRVVPDADHLAVEFELFNVVTGERLLGYSQPATTATLRLAAHRVADRIYEKILGVPGAFATRIAYVSLEGSGAQRHWRLVVADADGENARTVVESPEPLMSPAWSPDGTRLAYVSFEGRLSAIFVQSLATGER